MGTLLEPRLSNPVWQPLTDLVLRRLVLQGAPPKSPEASRARVSKARGQSANSCVSRV